MAMDLVSDSESSYESSGSSESSSDESDSSVEERKKRKRKSKRRKVKSRANRFLQEREVVGVFSGVVLMNLKLGALTICVCVQTTVRDAFTKLGLRQSGVQYDEVGCLWTTQLSSSSKKSIHRIICFL